MLAHIHKTFIYSSQYRCRHWRTLLCSLLRLWRTLDPAGLCGPLLRPAPLHHPGAGRELIPVCEILLFHSWRFVMCVYCAYDARPTPLLLFNFIILRNMDAASQLIYSIIQFIFLLRHPNALMMKVWLGLSLKVTIDWAGRSHTKLSRINQAFWIHSWIWATLQQQFTDLLQDTIQ